MLKEDEEEEEEVCWLLKEDEEEEVCWLLKEDEEEEEVCWLLKEDEEEEEEVCWLLQEEEVNTTVRSLKNSGFMLSAQKTVFMPVLLNSNMLVYLRDGSARTIVHTATLR